MKRIIAVILTVCMVLALGVTASAAETKNITASYRDVTIVADGTPIVPRDASGAPRGAVHLQRHHLSARPGCG